VTQKLALDEFSRVVHGEIISESKKPNAIKPLDWIIYWLLGLLDDAYYKNR
jgi:hypothetical protein